MYVFGGGCRVWVGIWRFSGCDRASASVLCTWQLFYGARLKAELDFDRSQFYFLFFLFYFSGWVG